MGLMRYLAPSSTKCCTFVHALNFGLYHLNLDSVFECGKPKWQSVMEMSLSTHFCMISKFSDTSARSVDCSDCVVQVLMRPDSGYRLHIVKSNWTVRREAPSKLRATGAKLIKWGAMLRFFKTMKDYSPSQIHWSWTFPTTAVAHLLVTVCSYPLSPPNTLTHMQEVVVRGLEGQRNLMTRQTNHKSRKRKAVSQSVIMLPLAHFIPLCKECFLWLFPCWKNLG